MNPAYSHYNWIEWWVSSSFQELENFRKVFPGMFCLLQFCLVPSCRGTQLQYSQTRLSGRISWRASTCASAQACVSTAWIQLVGGEWEGRWGWHWCFLESPWGTLCSGVQVDYCRPSPALWQLLGEAVLTLPGRTGCSQICVPKKTSFPALSISPVRNGNLFINVSSEPRPESSTEWVPNEHLLAERMNSSQ